MVLTVSFVLSLVTGLSCHHHPQEALLLKNLTPASGRQDHTTSPSARIALSSVAQPASIASQPYVRDDRETPLCVGRDGERYGVIWSYGVTVTVHLIPIWFSDCVRQRPSGSDGFGPRLPGLRVRRVSRSSRVRKPSFPSGRPTLSAERRRANSSGSGSLASRSAKRG